MDEAILPYLTALEKRKIITAIIFENKAIMNEFRKQILERAADLFHEYLPKYKQAAKRSRTDTSQVVNALHQRTVDIHTVASTIPDTNAFTETDATVLYGLMRNLLNPSHVSPSDMDGFNEDTWITFSVFIGSICARTRD